VRLLLGNDGVMPDIQARGGCTALILAAHNGHEAVVRLLLEQEKVDTDAAVWYLAVSGRHAMLQLLCKQDGISDKSRDKALTLAEYKASIKCVQGCDNISIDNRCVVRSKHLCVVLYLSIERPVHELDGISMDY
jgi:Ankyrin repeats (3 copies)